MINLSCLLVMERLNMSWSCICLCPIILLVWLTIPGNDVKVENTLSEWPIDHSQRVFTSIKAPQLPKKREMLLCLFGDAIYIGLEGEFVLNGCSQIFKFSDLLHFLPLQANRPETGPMPSAPVLPPSHSSLVLLTIRSKKLPSNQMARLSMCWELEGLSASCRQATRAMSSA